MALVEVVPQNQRSEGYVALDAMTMEFSKLMREKKRHGQVYKSPATVKKNSLQADSEITRARLVSYLCMYVYVCIYVYVCVCMYVCMYVCMVYYSNYGLLETDQSPLSHNGIS